MKKNLIIVLAVVAVLIIGGVYLFIQNKSPGAEEENNVPDANQSSGQESGQTYNVELKSFEFSPSNLTINAGDTVIWTNRDSFSHTVISSIGGEMDSPNFGKDKTYSHTFNTAGTFPYHCALHPSMKGTIIVE